MATPGLWQAAYDPNTGTVAAAADWHGPLPAPALVTRIRASNRVCSLENHLQPESGPVTTAPSVGSVPAVAHLVDLRPRRTPAGADPRLTLDAAAVRLKDLPMSASKAQGGALGGCGPPGLVVVAAAGAATAHGPLRGSRSAPAPRRGIAWALPRSSPTAWPWSPTRPPLALLGRGAATPGPSWCSRPDSRGWPQATLPRRQRRHRTHRAAVRRRCLAGDCGRPSPRTLAVPDRVRGLNGSESNWTSPPSLRPTVERAERPKCPDRCSNRASQVDQREITEAGEPGNQLEPSVNGRWTPPAATNVHHGVLSPRVRELEIAARVSPRHCAHRPAGTPGHPAERPADRLPTRPTTTAKDQTHDQHQRTERSDHQPPHAKHTDSRSEAQDLTTRTTHLPPAKRSTTEQTDASRSAGWVTAPLPAAACGASAATGRRWFWPVTRRRPGPC